MMIASGSIHAVVNAILKGGKDKMAGRALIDGSSAVLLLPATLLVPLPTAPGAGLPRPRCSHCVYLLALSGARGSRLLRGLSDRCAAPRRCVTAALAIGVFGEPSALREMTAIALIGGAMFVMVSGRHIEPQALGWALCTGVTHRRLHHDRRAGLARRADADELHRLDVRADAARASVTLFAPVARAVFASAERGAG